VPVLTGADVRFLSEGDVVDQGLLIKQADPTSQHVEWVKVSGGSPQTASTGEGR